MADFSSEDTLLFYAIAYECTHKGVATLHGIFSAEDAINRSAPTFDEMKSGINLLISTKLITDHQNGFKLTAEGESLYAAANQYQAPVFERLDHLTKKLSTQFSETPVENDFDLHLEVFRQAYKAYYGAT